MNNPPGISKIPQHFRLPGLAREKALNHAVFTRWGGVSPPPFDTLNTSFAVGDDPDCVALNLSRVQKTLDASALAYMEQCHGVGSAVLENHTGESPREVPAVDALMTDRPGEALVVKQADCQGVILFDNVKRVVAVVHCGWRGNVKNILGRTVERMREEFGCRARDMAAAIGPSLGPCCAEFVGYREIFPVEFKRFEVRENHFDLWALSREQLKDAGLDPNRIETANVCTRCRMDLFYSYRGEGRTGRFATLALLSGQ